MVCSVRTLKSWRSYSRHYNQTLLALNVPSLQHISLATEIHVYPKGYLGMNIFPGLILIQRSQSSCYTVTISFSDILQSSLIYVGAGMAAVGLVGRYIIRSGLSKKIAAIQIDVRHHASNVVGYSVCEMFWLINLFLQSIGSKYYKGGFEPKMNRREAALILGVSPTANKTKIKVGLEIFFFLTNGM